MSQYINCNVQAKILKSCQIVMNAVIGQFILLQPKSLKVNYMVY